MSTVTTIGLNIAKSVFQVHGVDAEGVVIIRRQVRRGQVLKFFASLPPCLIGIEACASAHHWSRELQGLGHEVRLMPPAYVKPYVKRQKNDMADAEAICEAVSRPTMRFVETKTCEQQSILMLHRVRLMQVRQRTMLTNAIRAHLAEFGLVAKIGREGVDELLLLVRGEDERIRAGSVLRSGARRATDAGQAPDPGDGPAHHRVPLGQRGQPPPSRDPRSRSAARQCSGGPCS